MHERAPSVTNRVRPRTRQQARVSLAQPRRSARFATDSGVGVSDEQLKKAANAKRVEAATAKAAANKDYR